MLKYFGVATDLIFVDITTTSLEVTIQYKFESIRKTIVHLEDGAEVGNECNNAQIELEFPEWRTFTNNQLLILRENKASDHSSFDRRAEFSIQASELSSCFD